MSPEQGCGAAGVATSSPPEGGNAGCGHAIARRARPRYDSRSGHSRHSPR
ncbi:conserved hypothetical protein [Citreicella sp. SE45]|nr:conserved hypothetical protein [Citreicella sp. SE45]